ncbi:MAG: tetratricopeptide repeat protein [Alphaproteobacteria bacterium]|nr:tetratricopeptide repeat protein [Alphaproteobacteria bacterium]
MNRRPGAALAAPLLFALLGGAEAADAPRDTYAHCLALLERNPEAAFSFASTWRDDGGGAPARHCVALALVDLGSPGEGASRLDDLAREADAGDAATRAQILSQAGNAWLLQGETGRAANSFTSALAVLPSGSPLAADLRLDRGRTFALLEDYPKAEEEFTAALAARPGFVDALVLRANAERAQGLYAKARADIASALALAPKNAQAWFERGTTDYLTGDIEGARAALGRSLSLEGEGPVADAARAVLQQIERPRMN